METEENGHRPGGRWVSDGGRLHWEAASEDAEAAGHITPDEDLWSSDEPPLPAGAPERVKLRVALAWVRRQLDLAHDRENALILLQRQQRLHSADQPAHRRQSPQIDPLAQDLAHAEGAIVWLEDALAALQDEAERSPGRALVEWYLWILTANPAEPDDDPLGQERARGMSEMHKRAQRYAERLAARDYEDE
jgi:hypothetical protein